MATRFPAGVVPAPIVDLCQKLDAAGHRAWVVGGCVRDVLAGKSASDWDVATSARPPEVKKVFRRVIETGIAHGTVTVLHQGASVEVTTLRGEGAYSDGRRPDSVHFVSDIDEDLARRDFTVNAMAYDPLHDVLVDPFGGQEDMARKVIRAVGVPQERFNEDGLRVLRAARFSATLEFSIDSETETAMGQTLSTFKKVSPERVRDEWLKSMKAKKPSRAFRAMERTGILAVTYPELAQQVGCAQNMWHAFDVWEHSLECLDALEGDPVLRLAGLLHDVGKPRTRAMSEKTNDYTFFHHEAVGADMADRWMRAFRFSNEERERVVHLVRHHLVCYSDEWTDAAVRRFIKRVGPEQVADLLLLARADALGKGRPVQDELSALVRLADRVRAIEAAGHALSARDLVVKGADVMAHLQMPQSRLVGVILSRMLDAVLDDPSLNDRDALLALATRVAQEETGKGSAS